MKQAPVIFDKPINHLDEFLKNCNSQVVFLVDENTLSNCLPLLMELSKEISQVDYLEIPSGEKSKDIINVVDVWRGLLDLKVDRKSVLINLGGGVITDFGGFVASTYKRGIRFINIPTSLLAMADASVGGKTGIDFYGLKNQIGTFSQPEMVIIEPEFLKTLPYNQLNSGFAELLKHGLIQDKKHWEDLISIKKLTPESIAPYIKHSIEIKKRVVEADPKENGLRKILNAGHTIGHAIESYFLIEKSSDNINELLHGEAVAIGLIMESYISYKIDMLSYEELMEITKNLIRFFPKRNLPKYEDIEEFLYHDKKNENGIIQFLLLKKIGVCEQQPIVVQRELIKEAYEFYLKN